MLNETCNGNKIYNIQRKELKGSKSSSKRLEMISALDPLYEAIGYPLLFSHGETGWSLESSVTFSQYLSCRLLQPETRYEFRVDDPQLNYIDSQTNIILICKTHGCFAQIPNNHLRGKGCKKCANKLNAEKRKKPNEQFILEAENIHKDENNIPIYDYSEVNYISTHEKVNIICKIHGSFEQCPSDHLSGRGCNGCGMIKRAKTQTFTKELFIQKAKEVHGDDKYDYSQVDYINSQTKITLKCNICEYVFEQQPNSHLQGCGCDKCAHMINHENQKLTKEEITEQIAKFIALDNQPYGVVEDEAFISRMELVCKIYAKYILHFYIHLN